MSTLIHFRVAGAYPVFYNVGGEVGCIQPVHTYSQVLESPMNLMHGCFWTLGRSQREPTQAQGSHVNSKQKGPSLDLNPSCFELKVLTLEPPCFYIIIVLNLYLNFVCRKNR